MKWGNRKGFTGIEIIVLIGVIGLVSYFAGPSLGKSVNNVFQGERSQKKATRSIQSVRTLYQTDPQHPDKLIPVQERYQENSYNLDSIQPPETLWQRFWRLGATAVIIIVLLSYLGLWPIITLWWNKKIKPKIDSAKENLQNLQIEHDELSSDAKLIVKSVDAGIAELDKHIAAVKFALDSVQDDISVANNLTDPAQKQIAVSLAQQKLTVMQAVYSSVVNMKQDFKDALAIQQNSSTKTLVDKFQNS